MPKITASIPHRKMVKADMLGSSFPGKVPPGSVVNSFLGVSIGGPYLVCQENAKQPLDHSGCPNGECRTFLVDLERGERYNLKHFDPDTMFFEVQCEMVVSG